MKSPKLWLSTPQSSSPIRAGVITVLDEKVSDLEFQTFLQNSPWHQNIVISYSEVVSNLCENAEMILKVESELSSLWFWVRE